MTNDDLPLLLHAAGERLAATRPGVVARAPWPLAERFDDAPEAEWGPNEVLAHVAEMIPFWQGEIERIIAGAAAQNVAAAAAGDAMPEPVPFGRVATDGVRLAILGATDRCRRPSCTTGSTARSSGSIVAGPR